MCTTTHTHRTIDSNHLFNQHQAGAVYTLPNLGLIWSLFLIHMNNTVNEQF